MKLLPSVPPTPEQLAILGHDRPGPLVLKGAAGSGKTTTALLRLRQQCRAWLARRTRLGLTDPVRVLVLTYNRTLEGYIAALASEQVDWSDDLELTVSTFARWSRDLLIDDGRSPSILGYDDTARLLRPLIRGIDLPERFLFDEVDYILGRFKHDGLDDYLTSERRGRGRAPRVDTALRRRLLDDVVTPYQRHNGEHDVQDWNDIAVAAAGVTGQPLYDVVIIDEAQDFSANQMRAVLGQLADPHSLTIVMDSVQRIYPRGFVWKEVGLTVSANLVRTLTDNHRNTREIAAFARPLVEALPVEDDGALPDFNSCHRSGDAPVVLAGKFSDQVAWALNHIGQDVDLVNESVVFLQPYAGKWFDYTRQRLQQAGLVWCELTGNSVWPSGPQQVALCTFHSAKGLEFDHVFILGLNQQVTPHEADADDISLDALRRLVAMGIGRARMTVTLGYKDDDPSTIIGLLDPATYKAVTV